MENFYSTSNNRQLPDGKSEIYRIYYDKNYSSFNNILLIETITIYHARLNNYKIFKALASNYIETYLICKN